MLILSRKIGEILRIEDTIQILLLGIDQFQAKIGIQAPLNMAIYREELYLRIKNEQASKLKVLKPS